MIMKNRKWMAGIALVAVLAGTVALAPMASAEPIASSLIAQDTTPAPPVAPAAIVVGVDANIPAGLTVNGSQGKPVSIATKGEKTRSAVSKPGAPVVFRALTPGKAYTVSIAGKRIGTATPVATPSPTWGLTVSTTDTAGSVALSWQHQVTRPQGTVAYTVTATPRGFDARTLPSLKQVTATTAATNWQLDGLDPSALYTFTVVPVNSAATGQGSTAVMNRTLADIWGKTQVAVDTAPTPALSAAPPAPAPASAPAPAPGPSTRTIYVCPAGVTESASGVCEKSMAYTYATVAYTYHAEPNYVQVQVGTTERSHPFDGNACGWGTLYGNTCYEYSAVYETRQQGTNQVKDAAPAGYTDNGSAWTKKDPMPPGYADNGTAWISTVAKVATTVPA